MENSFIWHSSLVNLIITSDLIMLENQAVKGT